MADKKGRTRRPSRGADPVLNSVVKRKKVSPSKPEAVERDPYYRCCACGHKYETQNRNFSMSQSPFFHGNNKYLPICVKCVDNFTNQYEEILNTQDEAVKRMCLHWDIYYNDSLIESSKKVAANQSRMRSLIKQCNMIQHQGKTYDTHLKEAADKAGTGVIESKEDIKRLEKEENIKISKKSIKMWGFGHSPQDIEFLDEAFADWKDRTIVEGKGRESLVKQLCVLELQQSKALIEERFDLYNKIIDTYQRTLDRANLTPKITDANDKADEKPIGVMFEMFENEEPAPEPLDCWKDVDGIRKLILVYFIGHLCSMLGLKNRYARMYEEEMDKYRVDIPELEDADSEDIYEYILNNGHEVPDLVDGVLDEHDD